MIRVKLLKQDSDFVTMILDESNTAICFRATDIVVVEVKPVAHMPAPADWRVGIMIRGQATTYAFTGGVESTLAILKALHVPLTLEPA